jgi:hypothetical protein
MVGRRGMDGEAKTNVREEADGMQQNATSVLKKVRLSSLGGPVAALGVGCGSG